MDRAELVEELAGVLRVSRKEAKAVLEEILECMVRALRNGERIEIRRFGSFRTYLRPPRRGRNPQTGRLVAVPAKRVLSFREAAELRALVNKLAERKYAAGS